MATYLSNSDSLGNFMKNEYVPVSPSPTFRESPESSLSYNQQQVEESDQNCILTIIYELLLNGNVNLSGSRDFQSVIKTEAQSNNNCYATCAITLVEAYNIDYDVLHDFCRSRFEQRSINRRMSSQKSSAINQIERLLDILGFTIDLVPIKIRSVKEQEQMLNNVKTNCDTLIRIYEQNHDNEHKQKYTALRDKIQRRQDQQKDTDQIQKKIQENFIQMSRKGGKKKMGKHRKTKRSKN